MKAFAREGLANRDIYNYSAGRVRTRKRLTDK